MNGLAIHLLFFYMWEKLMNTIQKEPNTNDE